MEDSDLSSESESEPNAQSEGLLSEEEDEYPFELNDQQLDGRKQRLDSLITQALENTGKRLLITRITGYKSHRRET